MIFCLESVRALILTGFNAVTACYTLSFDNLVFDVCDRSIFLLLSDWYSEISGLGVWPDDPKFEEIVSYRLKVYVMPLLDGGSLEMKDLLSFAQLLSIVLSFCILVSKF